MRQEIDTQIPATDLLSLAEAKEHLRVTGTGETAGSQPGPGIQYGAGTPDQHFYAAGQPGGDCAAA